MSIVGTREIDRSSSNKLIACVVHLFFTQTLWNHRGHLTHLVHANFSSWPRRSIGGSSSKWQIAAIRNQRRRSITLLHSDIIRLDVGRLWQHCSRMQRAGIRLRQLVTCDDHIVCLGVSPKPSTVRNSAMAICRFALSADRTSTSAWRSRVLPVVLSARFRLLRRSHITSILLLRWASIHSLIYLLMQSSCIKSYSKLKFDDERLMHRPFLTHPCMRLKSNVVCRSVSGRGRCLLLLHQGHAVYIDRSAKMRKAFAF